MTTKPFIPGFETEKDAIKAGEKFFAKSNGRKGIYDRDFHIVPNAQGRWHFKEGPGAKVVDWSRHPASA